MGLELKLNHLQTNYGNTWQLIDATGAWSAGNLTGWKTATSGGTNIQIDNQSLAIATLDIIKPDMSTKHFNLLTLSTWNALTPYTTQTPFTSGTDPAVLTYTLDESQMGSPIVDGIYQVRYYVMNTDTPTAKDSLVVFNVALYARVEACVQKIMYKFYDNFRCFRCDCELLCDATTIWGLYLSMIYAASIADAERFKEILAALQTLCGKYSTNCGS